MSDKQPNLSVRIVTYVLCAVVGAVLTMAANTYRIEHDPKSRFFIRIINRIREERAERQAERKKEQEETDKERRRRREVEKERDGLLEKLRRRTGEVPPTTTTIKGSTPVAYRRPDHESWGETDK